MRITVFLGTGGVGKTSVAAATALAQARAGLKSLVLTIAPALRLRTALDLKDGLTEQTVPLDPPASGELWAALLDVRATLDEAVRLYGASDTAARILTHPIYATIADSLVGMQELMAIERIDQLSKRGFEHIVVDTAPSRHAFENRDVELVAAGRRGRQDAHGIRAEILEALADRLMDVAGHPMRAPDQRLGIEMPIGIEELRHQHVDEEGIAARRAVDVGDKLRGGRERVAAFDQRADVGRGKAVQARTAAVAQQLVEMIGDHGGQRRLHLAVGGEDEHTGGVEVLGDEAQQ
jgi:hypothetical protein